MAMTRPRAGPKPKPATKAGPGHIVQIAESDTPIGRIGVAVFRGKLLLLSFGPQWRDIADTLEKRFGPVALDKVRDPGGVITELERYFNGRLDAIDRIEVDAGGTPFQEACWRELRRIPLGQTRSYTELARSVGRPKAIRAVGAANAFNPIAVVVPCHRAIGADGRLVGYGGGLMAKEWLLRHEGALL